MSAEDFAVQIARIETRIDERFKSIEWKFSLLFGFFSLTLSLLLTLLGIAIKLILAGKS